MKGKKKSNKFKMFIKNNLFLLLIVVATLFMSVGYATVNSVSLDLTGTSNIKSRPAVIITDATITSGTNGTDTLRSSIDMLHEDIMKSRIVLGSNQSATLTVSMTILNNTSDKRMFTGVTYGNNFYDNNKISYTLSGLNVEDTLAPGASKTFTITFSYNSSDISNNVLNSYLKFNFKKYWTITYSHIDTTNKNYPDYILEDETTKTITFNGDIPYDVQISPSVTYTYTSPTLTLTNVTQDITINRYYSITYNLNGGTNGSNPPNKYLHGQTVTLPTPTNGNKTFGGWYKTSDFSTSAITDTSNQSENLNLYAKWSSGSYQLATSYITSLVGDASPTSTNIITINPPTGESCTNTFAFDGTSDNNLRYIGANPCNYVKFNCDSSGNCETWRIIGVMNGVDSDPVLKLVKNDNTLNRAWNNKNNNSWADSGMQTYLNNDYASSFNSGVLNNYALNAGWRIGAVAYNGLVSAAYTAEAGTTSSAMYIGLINVSDYYFATSGTNDTTRNTCLSSALNGNNITSTCYNNDYLFISGQNQWTINKSNQGNSVIYISNAGKAVRQNATSSYYYRPVVYLKSSIKIKVSNDSNGSINYPYELSYNN